LSVLVLASSACGLSSDGPDAPDATSEQTPLFDGAPVDVRGDVADARSDVGDAMDAASDVGMEAAADASDGCIPKTENCFNGADDDCNGLADCADPACGSSVAACVPPLPSGWTFVGYDVDTRANCPTGYGMPTDVEEGISWLSAQCTCSCNLNPASCTTGTFTMKTGDNGTCDNNNTFSNLSQGACVQLPNGGFDVPMNNVRATTAQPVGGGCTGSSTTVLPAVSYAHQGRTCTMTQTLGAGCAMGKVCAPAGGQDYKVCVQKSGVNACPNGYPVQHIAGTTLDDTRSCSACSCGYNSGSCSNAKIDIFTDMSCTMGYTFNADDQCRPPVSGSYKFYSYTAGSLINASCTASGGQPQGSVSGFKDARTICCTQ
jgi:hypothetical protein